MSTWPARENPFPVTFDMGLLGNMVVAWARGDVEAKRVAASNWTACAAAVAADFLRHVAQGRIILSGLQTAPRLEPRRSVLPKDWATLLVFNWTENSARLADAKFIGIVCEAKFVAGDARIGSTNPAAATPKQSAEEKRKGRPTFPLGRMVSLVVDQLHLREPNNKGEAKRLLALFAERYPGHKLPANETTVRHVGRIYVIAGQRAATLKA
jgi:hypothetical protein